jgi:acyl dehydratase
MSTAKTTTLPFNPREHRMVPTRWLEDFTVGEKFILPSRTMTDALFAAFQLASGDNHPVHYDVEYCRARGMPHMLAHGFQVLAQTCGGVGLFAHYVEDSLKGFIEQSSHFLGMVFVGDTLYVTLQVTEIIPQNTTGLLTLSSTVHNQRGELVMDGLQKYLLKKRPSAG